VHDHI